MVKLNNNTLRKIIKSLFIIALVLLFSLTQNSLTVAALTQAQKDSLKSGARYFNTEQDLCAPSTTSGNQGGSVYFVGDSLTVGMRDSGQLAQKVTSSGRQVAGIQAAVGDTVADALTKIGSPEERSKIASANTVVVALGTNPAFNQNAAGTTFTPRINEMISSIKSANSSAAIYWMNAYKDGDTDAYRGINNAINSRSGPLGYKVINWNTEARNNNSSYAPFDAALRVHPSNYGALATFVVSALGSVTATTTTSGNCACGSGSTSLRGSNIVLQIMNFFVDNGFEPYQAAGIVGNMAGEFPFNPTRPF